MYAESDSATEPPVARSASERDLDNERSLTEKILERLRTPKDASGNPLDPVTSISTPGSTPDSTSRTPDGDSESVDSRRIEIISTSRPASAHKLQGSSPKLSLRGNRVHYGPHHHTKNEHQNIKAEAPVQKSKTHAPNTVFHVEDKDHSSSLTLSLDRIKAEVYARLHKAPTPVDYALPALDDLVAGWEAAQIPKQSSTQSYQEHHCSSDNLLCIAGTSPEGSASQKNLTSVRNKTAGSPLPNSKPRETPNAQEKPIVASPRQSKTSPFQCGISTSDLCISSSAGKATLLRTLPERSDDISSPIASPVNNPKLLATVEDAIKRLVLPQLAALKKERHMREKRAEAYHIRRHVRPNTRNDIDEMADTLLREERSTQKEGLLCSSQEKTGVPAEEAFEQVLGIADDCRSENSVDQTTEMQPSKRQVSNQKLQISPSNAVAPDHRDYSPILKMDIAQPSTQRGQFHGPSGTPPACRDPEKHPDLGSTREPTVQDQTSQVTENIITHDRKVRTISKYHHSNTMEFQDDHAADDLGNLSPQDLRVRNVSSETKAMGDPGAGDNDAAQPYLANSDIASSNDIEDHQDNLSNLLIETGYSSGYDVDIQSVLQSATNAVKGLLLQKVLDHALSEGADATDRSRSSSRSQTAWSTTAITSAHYTGASTVSRDRKRSRGGGVDPGDEGSDDSDSDDDGDRPRKKGSSNRIPRRRLKCPFYQRHPQRFTKAACTGPGFSEMGKLKDHLKRVHMQPLRCPRCHIEFDSDSELVDHLSQDDKCIKVNKPHDERIAPQTLRRLDFKKAPFANAKSTEEKWKMLYKMLFPEDAEADIPSPYDRNSLPPELADALSEALEVEITQELAGILEPVVTRMKARIPAIIDRCRTRLARKPITTRETENRTAPTIKPSITPSAASEPGILRKKKKSSSLSRCIDEGSKATIHPERNAHEMDHFQYQKHPMHRMTPSGSSTQSENKTAASSSTTMDYLVDENILNAMQYSRTCTTSGSVNGWTTYDYDSTVSPPRCSSALPGLSITPPVPELDAQHPANRPYYNDPRLYGGSVPFDMQSWEDLSNLDRRYTGEYLAAEGQPLNGAYASSQTPAWERWERHQGL